MKRCLLCGYFDKCECATCPMCGEATWARMAPPEPEPVVEEPAPEPEPAAKPRRGRR